MSPFVSMGKVTVCWTCRRAILSESYRPASGAGLRRVALLQGAATCLPRAGPRYCACCLLRALAPGSSPRSPLVGPLSADDPGSCLPPSGDAGAILATTDGGAHWKAQTSGTTKALSSVAFTDATHGWAVGGNGTILVYNAAAAGKVSTKTRLSGPASVKLKKALQLSGTVSPAAAPGSVTITKSHLVGAKWKAAGSAKVNVVGGTFAFSFKPTSKGSWRFVASYSGGSAGGTTYKASKSVVKSVKVK